MAKRDYYAVLGVSRNASEDELKSIEDSNTNYAQRDDATISKLPIDEVLKNAPKKDGNFFIVKKVIDEE